MPAATAALPCRHSFRVAVLLLMIAVYYRDPHRRPRDVVHRAVTRRRRKGGPLPSKTRPCLRLPPPRVQAQFFTSMRLESKSDNNVYFDVPAGVWARAFASGLSATATFVKLKQKASQTLFELEYQVGGHWHARCVCLHPILLALSPGLCVCVGGGRVPNCTVGCGPHVGAPKENAALPSRFCPC